MPSPKTSYTKSGDVNVAYQVLGEGPPDLVYVWGWLSHLDFQWTDPTIASFLRRLASFSRLIMFDKRGMGLSDPVGSAPTFEERMDDIRAVLDAVGSERAALLGFSEGAALSVLFAASYPERTSGLILYDSVVVGAMADEPDPNWVKSSKIVLDTVDRWGEGETMKWIAPSLPRGGAQQRFWGAFERAAASPGMARGLWEAIQRADVRPVMPMVSVPTLVLHHADSSIPNSQGRLLAERIPGARYVELPGRDHIPGAGDPEAIAGEIEEFITGTRAAGQPDRVLATVLFTTRSCAQSSGVSEAARSSRQAMASLPASTARRARSGAHARSGARRASWGSSSGRVSTQASASGSAMILLVWRSTSQRGWEPRQNLARYSSRERSRT
jgi:pimeloyl-ACP methyl ester carboxylesterase